MRPGRLLVALGALVVTLVVAEGLLSLLAGRSLAEVVGARPQEVREWRAPTDDDLIAAAARNPGHYRAHVDPLVGMTLKAESTFDIFEGTVTTDARGMRARPGAPPPEDAFHVVVLGDSVAFGWGVDDDEVLAHRLETILAEVAAPDARPVVCSTVAVPGWNLRNAVQFLLGQLDEIDPDVVLLLPIGNDLANTYSVRDTGHRRDVPDVATRDPWLRVSVDSTEFVLLEAARRLKRSGGLLGPAGFDPAALGPPSLNADLSPESSVRFDEAAAAVRRLHLVLEARGGHLALLHYIHERFAWHLLARLDDLEPDLPVVPLLKQVEREFTIGHDPHPNATTHDVFAVWCAEFLLERGWVPGAEGHAPLPEVPAVYTHARSPLWPVQRRRDQAELQRREDLALLRPAIDVPSAQGLYQIYGGLNPDGSAGPSLAALLADGGEVLEISLATLEGRDDLLPLSLVVVVDDETVHAQVLTTPGAHTLRVELAPVPPGTPREVSLRATPHVLTRYSGRPQIACYRLEGLALTRD